MPEDPGLYHPVVEPEGEEDLYLMANLEPELTGLPFVVWISQRGGARHDIRVKVTKGPKLIAGEFDASVAIRPEVRVMEGSMSGSHLALLRSWINLNREMIIDYWNGDILTGAAIYRLRKLR